LYRSGQEEIEAVKRVLKSPHWNRFSNGNEGGLEESEMLEREWANFFNSKNALFTTSGTAALMLACVGAGLGPGDEVIVPGYTWIATAAAPLAVGAIPVITDIDESLTLDPKALEAAITLKTKAIIPVHMNGYAASIEKIRIIAKKHGLIVIEDACQASGGWGKNARLGTLGNAGVFSFNHYKILSSGEGGMLITDDPHFYERALIYHDCGSLFRSYSKGFQTAFFTGINLKGNCNFFV